MKRTAFSAWASLGSWDLYNEPTNSGMDHASLSPLQDAFRWAREINPSHPITSGVWDGSPRDARFMLAESNRPRRTTRERFNSSPGALQPATVER